MADLVQDKKVQAGRVKAQEYAINTSKEHEVKECKLTHDVATAKNHHERQVSSLFGDILGVARARFNRNEFLIEAEQTHCIAQAVGKASLELGRLHQVEPSKTGNKPPRR